MIKPDGGQAFPVPAGQVNDDGSAFYPTDGMTLRDYFAAAALMGLLASPHGLDTRAGAAKTAYELADCMIAARLR